MNEVIGHLANDKSAVASAAATATYTSLDLFAGAGGLSLGLHEAGINSICAVEYDKYAAQTFERNFPKTKVYCADVRTVDFAKYRGQIDIVCGGPPCQPFSSGGLRNASDDVRDMIPFFIEAVRVVEPRAFLMENVNGLTVGERRVYLGTVITKLENLGYTVTWQVLNAADYGVPQLRKRLIIIGVREGKFVFPPPTHGPQANQPYVSAGEALANVGSETVNTAKVTFARNPDCRPNPYHGQLYNGGGRPIDLEQPAPTILASAGGNKTHFLDKAGLVVPYHEHLVRGGAPRTGDLPGARRLSVEESAALQTFPAAMTFAGPQSSKYRQIGNAVPPKLASAIGGALAAHLTHPEAPKFALISTQLGLFTEKDIDYMAKQKPENLIHSTIINLMAAIDRFLAGNGLQRTELPPAKVRQAVDTLINSKLSASVKTGCLFLTFYKLTNPSYAFERIPIGFRGREGDKLLGSEMKTRYITLGYVTAWGENIGSKGDLGNFNLKTDSRFGPFITEISQANVADVEKAALYMASFFAASQTVPTVLPPLSADTLSFVRAKALFKSLAEAKAGGSIQQFLVAALLKVLRTKQNIRVETHNFNAADKFDKTAGDIEEFIEDKLLRAYEVSVRPDWKSRLPDFREKMDKAGLTKYIILAADVNTDDELREPAAMALFLDGIQRDIAVVDIMDFLTFMAAELSALELQEAVNDVYKLLITPSLGGKQAHIQTYLTTVGQWIDSVAQKTP